MSFDDLLADCNDAFDEAFAESPQPNNAGAVCFHPKTGPVRWITDVIIDRTPPEKIEPGQKGSTFTLKISVPNNAVTGISSAEFDPGVQSIDVPIVFGGPLVNRSFSSDKFEQDGGRISLKVR